MERFILTDAQWAKMEPRCLGKPGDPGRSGKDNRLFVEAVLWVVRTGSPWRDLPPAFGNLVRFVRLPGPRFDTVGVPPLLDGVAFGALIGDTAFDSNDIVADLNERGAKVVIAQHPRRVSPLDIDGAMYKWRHLIENFFCKLKEFKRIALRADKTDQSFAAMIYIAAAVINSR